MSDEIDVFAEIGAAIFENDMARDYVERHGIEAAPFLTVTNDDLAFGLALNLSDRVEGKTVVEIGGGLGLLSMHLGQFAKRVYCIEANPIWSIGFGLVLLKRKPKNVSFLFGSADEFAGVIKADIAIFCTHSGVDSMTAAGKLFAPEVVDVYGELIEGNPGAFDRTASILRKFV